VVLPYENTVSFMASNNWVFDASAQFGDAAREAMLASGARWGGPLERTRVGA
jgi:hypothetical protein